MNLNKLFELQAKLDERIYKEHPVQEGEDRLAKKILALQVELGELANCWRGFKYWSNDQEPITKIDIGTSQYSIVNPLLEEYVDCLHFILSIGLELGFEKQTAHSFKNGNSILGNFHSIYSELSSLYYHRQMYNYQRALNLIIGLGELLGFTWQQIEQAYLKKNKINHERQNNGY